MRAHLVRWLINTLALYLAVRVVPGVEFDGHPLGLVAVAAIFGLVNATVRPLLALLTCPLVMVTLGLFLLIINAVMLRLTAWCSDRFGLGFHVDGFWPAFWAGLLVGLVSLVLSSVVGGREVEVRVIRRRGRDRS